jgi:hypothetical protein
VLGRVVAPVGQRHFSALRHRSAAGAHGCPRGGCQHTGQWRSPAHPVYLCKTSRSVSRRSSTKTARTGAAGPSRCCASVSKPCRTPACQARPIQAERVRSHAHCRGRRWEGKLGDRGQGAPWGPCQAQRPVPPGCGCQRCRGGRAQSPCLWL